jgi:hypothetical protein
VLQQNKAKYFAGMQTSELNISGRKTAGLAPPGERATAQAFAGSI